MSWSRSGFAALLTLTCAAAAALAAPADPAARDARVEDLLGRLTREERIALVSGAGFETHAVPRLGIPPLTMTDGPVGVRWGTATAFPAGIALAASWDTALTREVAGAIAREARAAGRHVLLGPCVNIARVPLGGRTFEGFGEDPWLASRLAVAYVRGVQAEGVAACVKHFAANNQEWERNAIDARIDERALRELYLPAFRAAVGEGGVWSVMSAYNKVNGLWCSENPWLLRDVLKREWGFDGLVVSDWGAVHSLVATANAGLDLEMPDGAHFVPRDFAAAMDRGAIADSTLAGMTRRILRTLDRVGALDGAAPAPAGFDTLAHRALALEAARRSLVLLANRGDVLPLDRARIRSLAVLGPNAAVARTGGGGSSYVNAVRPVSPLEGLHAAAGPGVAITYAAGADLPDQLTPIPPGVLRTPTADGGKPGLRAEYFVGREPRGKPALTRVDAAVDFDWSDRGPAAGLPNDDFAARWSGDLVPPESGEYALRVRADDGVRLWLDGRLVIDDWSDHGARTSTAVARLRAGQRHRVVLEYYEHGGAAMVRFGWQPTGGDPLGEAVDAARAADAAVVVVGTSSDLESEGFDRASLELPAGQAELIRAVAAVQPRTAVVVVAGAPVAMEDWIDAAPAVLDAWFAGEQGGTAIGEAVFGDATPGGKLPVSFPKRWPDSSAYPDYPGRDLVTRYSDGVFVGYRHHDRAGVAPRFPFGHGLSYTTFGYSDLRIDSTATGAGRRVAVSFALTNTGARRGGEVAQVYVGDPQSRLPRPPRELKAFARVELAPGESRRVTLELDPGAFEYFDPERGGWVREPGAFTIEVGASSRDLRLSGTLRAD